MSDSNQTTGSIGGKLPQDEVGLLDVFIETSKPDVKPARTKRAPAWMAQQLKSTHMTLRESFSVRAAAAHTWALLHRCARDDADGRALRAYVLSYVRDEAVERGVFVDVLGAQNSMEELDRTFQRALLDMQKTCDMQGGPPVDDDAALREENGIHRWDELLARFLEGNDFRGNGREAARILRSRAAERAEGPRDWRRWVEWSIEKDGALYIVAASLWADVVGPRMQEMARKPAALVVPVFEPTALALAKTAKLLDAAAANQDGPQLSLRLIDGSSLAIAAPQEAMELVPGDVATFDAATIKLIRSGAGLLSSLKAIRLFQWEVLEGHRQKIEGIEPHNIIAVEGGHAAIARRLDLKGGGSANDVRAILYAQRSLQFPLPGNGRGNLIALQEYEAQRGRPARVVITLSPPLLPDYVHHPSFCGTRPEDRKLVPMTALPPFVGRDQDKAPQAVFWLLLVIEMRRRARELVSEGGILLDPAGRFADLSMQAGLRRDLLGRVLDRWTRDGDDGPAPLLVTSGKRVIVREEAPRAYLLDAGHRELGGAELQRKAATNRAANLREGRPPTARRRAKR